MIAYMKKASGCSEVLVVVENDMNPWGRFVCPICGMAKFNSWWHAHVNCGNCGTTFVLRPEDNGYVVTASFDTCNANASVLLREQIWSMGLLDRGESLPHWDITLKDLQRLKLFRPESFLVLKAANREYHRLSDSPGNWYRDLVGAKHPLASHIQSAQYLLDAAITVEVNSNWECGVFSLSEELRERLQSETIERVAVIPHATSPLLIIDCGGENEYLLY